MFTDEVINDSRFPAADMIREDDGYAGNLGNTGDPEYHHENGDFDANSETECVHNSTDTHYLVDFENTGDSAFYNCPTLTEKDHVHIFYTAHSFRINMDFLAANPDADIRFYKVEAGKQSLDMHLVSFLGYLVGQRNNQSTRHFVISADTDYDNVIRFWNQSEEGPDIHRNLTLAGALTGQEAEDIQFQSPTIKEEAAAVMSEETAGEISLAQRKRRLNEDTQRLLMQTGMDTQAAGRICSIVCKNLDKKNYKQLVYREIISQMGQKKGLPAYKKIRCLL